MIALQRNKANLASGSAAGGGDDLEGSARKMSRRSSSMGAAAKDGLLGTGGKDSERYSPDEILKLFGLADFDDLVRRVEIGRAHV